MKYSNTGVRCGGPQRGFTLVEMSIVLVVIGLILGAVSIGGNLQRDAEHNKIKQKFIDQWVQAYNTYYQRTGVVIGDSQVQPRLMVNGANYSATTGNPISGGNMKSVTGPDPVCEGAIGPGMGGTANTNLHALLDALGIRMPPGRAEGSEDRYLYLDSNGNPQEIQVCFQWNKPATPSGSGNVMVITGLTPDLARTLDRMIDGTANASEGLFREQDVSDTATGAAGTQWSGDNTDEMAPTGTGTGNDSLDEHQVAVLVAHYKMNQ